MTDDWAKQKALELCEDNAFSLDIESALLEAQSRGEEKMRERAAVTVETLRPTERQEPRVWEWEDGEKVQMSPVTVTTYPGPKQFAAAIRSLPVGGENE